MKDKNTIGITRLKSFFDAGTFVEMGAYISRPGVEDETEGVVCGYGSLGGRLVFAFAQDPSLMKGALDGLHAEKIRRVYERPCLWAHPLSAFLTVPVLWCLTVPPLWQAMAHCFPPCLLLPV